MAADAAGREVKVLSSNLRIAAAALAILLILYLVRPGVSRLKLRIANSISWALARPVAIGSVQFRFLPRPGFDLENRRRLRRPSFRRRAYVASGRSDCRSAFDISGRGRLDISRLELSEPSLNLVRREDGRWNLEALLERAARTPLAPTSKSKGEARPGFPYIEASSGRINFKAGTGKETVRIAECGFCVMAGIRKRMGSSTESRTPAHRYELERHWPVAG